MQATADTAVRRCFKVIGALAQALNHISKCCDKSSKPYGRYYHIINICLILIVEDKWWFSNYCVNNIFICAIEKLYLMMKAKH